MNLPVPPPVDLSGLAAAPSLATTAPTPVAGVGAPLALTCAAVVAGVSAWRIAAIVADRRRAERRTRALVAAGTGLVVAGLFRWQPFARRDVAAVDAAR